MSKIKAAVDVREPEEIWAEVDAHDDIEDFDIMELASADIVVGGIGFERKTPSDYASSLVEGRLTEQVVALTEAFPQAYILIEGSASDFDSLSHTNINPASLRGSTASVMARYGVPVVFVEGSTMLIDYAVRLGRKHNEDPSSSYLPGSDVGVDEPVTKRIYGTLDGVGPERAESLYDAYPALTEIMEEDVSGVASVENIGQKTAERILSQLRDEG
jgi:ERCC4-type nuclease